jgi:hypothetical protein
MGGSQVSAQPAATSLSPFEARGEPGGPQPMVRGGLRATGQNEDHQRVVIVRAGVPRAGQKPAMFSAPSWCGETRHM